MRDKKGTKNSSSIVPILELCDQRNIVRLNVHLLNVAWTYKVDRPPYSVCFRDLDIRFKLNGCKTSKTESVMFISTNKTNA